MNYVWIWVILKKVSEVKQYPATEKKKQLLTLYINFHEPNIMWCLTDQRKYENTAKVECIAFLTKWSLIKWWSIQHDIK